MSKTNDRNGTPAFPTPPPGPQQTSKQKEVPDDVREEILNLHRCGYGTRKIAPRVGFDRKVIRRVLQHEGRLPVPSEPTPETSEKRPSKLDPFREHVEKKVRNDLTTTRILREIRDAGYEGGRTILGEYVQELRPTLGISEPKLVTPRFETRPGQEGQLDWSPFRLPMGGKIVVVHALGCMLCASRKTFIYFYRNERQPILLEGMSCSFEYFGGCPHRLGVDNMATAVLGRWAANGKPVWNPGFLAHARHYGYEPFACKPRGPNRKGKKEKFFRLLWDDFLKGKSFESFDDLNRQVLIWLDKTPEVGNLRIHGTTKEIPNEVWLVEKPLLIALPSERFPVYEDSVRVVDQDSTLSIHGTTYTVPSHLASRSVAVRLYAEHFEVLDRHRRVAFARRYVSLADKGKLIIDDTHYAPRKRRPPMSGDRLDEAFTKRFPELASYVLGLRHRWNRLAPIHVRKLLRLAEAYGEEALRKAITRANEYRRFDAGAVERILEREYPMQDDHHELPLGGV
jgi:transposase